MNEVVQKSNVSLTQEPFPKYQATIGTFSELMGKGLDGRIRLNEMTGRAEVSLDEGGVWQWMTDADEGNLRRFYQDRYGISNRANFADALNIFLAAHKVNPLTELLSGLEWDGKERAASFLNVIMGAEDTPANREVSRMIFRGGILRAYEPGCKWDYMPVLVGKQGAGKSTIVDWLSMGFSGIVSTFSGKEAFECLSGVWIGCVDELAAMRKAKDQEQIKSFLSARFDTYRKPYERNPVQLPRRCILIGCVNDERFLSDQTGNRRYFPVSVQSGRGRWLYENEPSVREYIRQCWAETVSTYKAGKLPRDYDHSLDGAFETARAEAMEEDWQIGMIDSYLEQKEPGELVCGLELWQYACYLDKDQYQTSAQRKLANYMDNKQGWHKLDRRVYVDGFGRQRCWQRDRESEH